MKVYIPKLLSLSAIRQNEDLSIRKLIRSCLKGEEEK